MAADDKVRALARKVASGSGRDPDSTERTLRHHGKPIKDPEGGLTAAGRAHYKHTEGANLKPGVKGPADTPEKMRRKGSFLARMFGPGGEGAMRKPDGDPTRRALSAKAWGEPVPKNEADRAALYQKGKRLLERYKNTREE